MHITQTDTMFLTVPSVFLLMIWVFRLDEHLFASGQKKNQSRRPRFANIDDDGEMVMTDPDGRIANSKHRRRA